MRFINKFPKRTLALLLSAVVIFQCAGCSGDHKIINKYNLNSEGYGLLYEKDTNSSDNHLLGSVVCIANENLLNEQVDMSLAQAAGLFNITDCETVYAKNIHEKLYPASTTKILTAYIVLKYGKLDDIATVTKENITLESGSSHCGLKEGDKISVKELLYGLMLKSANDAANVLADYISGSTEKFAELMNKEAALLGATNSHFVNAHGLHDENHYTTVYDLYLIFQNALKNDLFREITGSTSYIANFQDASGVPICVEWKNTMQYFTANQIPPNGATVLAGKTGTTSKALSCLVLLAKNEADKEYVSIILKSQDRGVLYEEMNDLLEEINK